MATIQNPRLELVKHDHKRHTATVKVTYTLRLNSVERNMTGLRWVEKIQLWGADWPDADDYLYSFATTAFSTDPDGSVGRVRTVTVGDDILDEDGFPRPTDEVYAKICVTPILPTPTCRNTNEISHRF